MLFTTNLIGVTKGRLQPLPGYSDFQYQQTAKYYLLAALQTGQSSWIFFEPIPTTGWTLAAVFIQDEILVNTKSLYNKLILINLQIISFFFFLFILLFRAYKGSFHIVQ